MKSEVLVERDRGDGNALALSSGNFRLVREFERLFEWVRLEASLIRKNRSCVEIHRQSLRTLGETEERLSEVEHWRDSSMFTGREKAALSLSEAISLNEIEELSELSVLLLKNARRYFSAEEIVRLTLIITTINDWIDFHDQRNIDRTRISGSPVHLTQR
jgi:AhpD family alkylhydroperoxidase